MLNSDLLKETITAAIAKEAELLVKEAKEKLEKRMPEIVAGIIVDIMGMSEMEILKDRIVFTIKTSKNEKI